MADDEPLTVGPADEPLTLFPGRSRPSPLWLRLAVRLIYAVAVELWLIRERLRVAVLVVRRAFGSRGVPDDSEEEVWS